MHRDVESSFIDAVSYAPFRNEWRDVFRAQGLLTVTIRGRDYTYIVPSWCAGLVAATDACPALSVGRLYNSTIKPRHAIAG